MVTAAKEAVGVIESGTGRITLHANGNVALLSELSSSYPLKLLSPRLPRPNVALVYALTYGGGLVAGDRVCLNVDVHDGAVLVILTQVCGPGSSHCTSKSDTGYAVQGSTKVFKTRSGQRHARPNVQSVDDFTSQRMVVTVNPGSTLFLLPDPVTCFRSARYKQLQTFKVAADASVVLLDWITSGRKALGEDWAFSKYYSLNEVWIDGKRIIRDAMLLEETASATPSKHGEDLQLPSRSLAERLAPYACYATVLIYGPLTETTIHHLLYHYAAITIFKHGARPTLIWSVSAICGGRGCVLRVAALETEDVRTWLRTALSRLEDVVGPDVYSKAFI